MEPSMDANLFDSLLTADRRSPSLFTSSAHGLVFVIYALWVMFFGNFSGSLVLSVFVLPYKKLVWFSDNLSGF